MVFTPYFHYVPQYSLLAVAPMAALTCLAFLVLMIESFIRESENVSFWVSVLGLLVCIVWSALSLAPAGVAFNSMVTVGGYGSFFAMVFLTGALLTIGLSRDYLQREGAHFGEFYVLILFATLGMMLIAAAADLIVLFLGVELMSLCLYVLAGFFRKRMTSNESSLKYFLLGAFATGFLLYGIALLYGATGTTQIYAIVTTEAYQASRIYWAGIALVLIGILFKVGAVPFHMWVPDVYEGAPTTVSAFMSTGAKAAAFSAAVMIFSRTVRDVSLVIAVIAAASMVLGNIVAISQSSVKRMLAYSSIAHAGYMLTGLAAGNQLGQHGILFYLVTYTFMNIGAFGLLSILEKNEKNLTFSDYAGLASRRPMLAAAMAVFMFSLAGIPPFAGFFGKYYVFAAAVSANLTWLAVLGVLMSVVSVYYYLRLVMVMYFQEPAVDEAITVSGVGGAVLAIACCAVIAMGIIPSAVLSIIRMVI